MYFVNDALQKSGHKKYLNESNQEILPFGVNRKIVKTD